MSCRYLIWVLRIWIYRVPSGFFKASMRFASVIASLLNPARYRTRTLNLFMESVARQSIAASQQTKVIDCHASLAVTGSCRSQ